MKTLIIFFAFLFAIGLIQAQTWSWESTPHAGQNILIHVDDVPETDGPVHLVYYCFDGTQLIAGDVGVLPNNKPNQIHAPVALHDHISWIRVVLKDQNNEILAADQKMVVNEKALPKAAQIEQALASAMYARPLGIEAKAGEVAAMFREAVQAYPQWLDDDQVVWSYYMMAKRGSSAEDLEIIKKQLTGLSEKSNDAPENLLVQSVRIAKDMADTTLQMTLRKKLDKKYPKSIMMQEDMVSAFTKAASVEEKIKIRDQFKTRFATTKENGRLLDQMNSTLVQQYASKEEWTNAVSYVDQITDPMRRADVCNQYAWTLSGESIEAEAPHLDVASQLSSNSLKLLSSDIPVPTGMTKKEWASSLDFYKAQFGDTYALILFKQGKYNEAVDHQAYAVKGFNYEEGEMNERYAVYLSKADKKDELEHFMDKIIVMGKANEKVKLMHKAYWSKNVSQEKLYDQYVAQLEAQAKALRDEKLKKIWEEKDAMSFTLKDLDGNEVSLADYKGKTVILDFWATWCGPCKASFPGMKKAVEHYAADGSVAFLFIDTWEGGDNVHGRVSDFIKNNNYPFHVLMDSENKIVADYKVDGIPTKFIIGPDQKIRFTSVGYSGNNDELVEELKAMIEMIRESSMPEKS